MTDALALDPISFPLRGRQLIEASAGTGKTYTITALYLRLLLGHGDAGPERPLGPEQILVVTFTEAATEELRDRIRSRIGDARLAFLLGSSPDPLLAQLLAVVDDHAAAARLLEQAAQQMDEAAIFTIHGFCQRMLRRHAFESGALFETELTQDDQALIRAAVLDFWRDTLYRMPTELAAAVLALWKTPDALLADLRAWLGHAELRLEPDLAEADPLQLYAARQQTLAQFKAAWCANRDDLEALIRASGINKSSYRKDFVPKWLAQIGRYCAASPLEPDSKTAEQLARFSQQTLQEKTKKGSVPQHPLFQQVDQVLASALPLREIMLARALREVRRRMAQHKRRHNLLTFDDLLSGLDGAIARAGGERLAAAIRQQFPLALIDEFQDTDPLQYRIFSTIYGDRPGCGLIMIGDPKQAIYAFRGADIFTYIGARRQVAAPYTLDTNWRSTRAMVAAVNRLFAQARSPFIYDQDIRFQSVQAAGHSDKTPLTVDGRPVPALTLWHQAGDPLNRTQLRQLFARATACEIDRLLSADTRRGEQPLQAGDIAVLVRDRYEAEAVRAALARCNRPCVYLSNRESVFGTQEARDLYQILQAVQEPGRERPLRAALATALLQLDAAALDRLNHDELAWEAAVAEFSEYQQSWLRLGVLPMLHQLLQRRNLAARLLSRSDGERRLTDLLHLGELLQQASTEVEGSAGLLRWLTEQLANPNGSAEEQQLRLESDRNLVTLVTVHKSKGLEYPVVFLPFAADLREARHGFYHDASGAPVLNLAGDEAALAAADRERLAEELRLLYVALTRSIYACYVGVSHFRIGSSPRSRLVDSALGYLLLGDGSALEAKLEQLAQAEGIQVRPPPLEAAQSDLFADANAPDEERLQARLFGVRLNRAWRVTSYSALSRHSGPELPELPGLDLEVSAERDQGVAAGLSIFSFPKGARAGTFLHGLFEGLDFPSARGASLQETIDAQLALAGYEAHWREVLAQLVHDVLDTPLQPGFSLRQLAQRDKQVELEFLLPVRGLEAPALSQLCVAEDPLSATAAALGFGRVEGMLKGFIDLVFRHQGRYYLLDYKSNHLGDAPEDYQPQRLAAAMIEHRYDLQYQLYSLALHRLLQLRLPDYDYAQHFGGVYYLFLRGVQAQGGNGIFFTRPSQPFIERLDRLFAEVA